MLLVGNQMMLNIKDALTLYKMLAPYTPKYENGSDILEFIGTIITNISASKEPWIFADAILLMKDVSLDELKENETFENIQLFMDGLADNSVLSLMNFCEELGINA
jgi:hypothetical protein